ncbi:unnamed protein product (macronuclear) [Paramecium tetraurelia]|uniref:Uncharacterized protein n=1 Tax=Paramecium tetraurelia TaxID=5888 RepID=A0D423_PARTE|nr:uncharacterized protein GSPATT00013255001 [Paramecium tetraurelia]CAK77790.1 unnamed protein product [Paramecium tetraurelia]|eukprot:XP_001445187.1 hypothetical protein (macronuclear) [Paramecium tetraurelia strain d4-2]
MSVKVQLIHQQWDDIRKVLRATQRKVNNNNNLSLMNCVPINNSQDQVQREGNNSDNELEFYNSNSNALLLIKDTCRNTRRKFYLSQKRRELSSQNDQEFYSQLQSRREQATKQRILYSNIKNFEKAIKQITTPKLSMTRPSTRIRQNSQEIQLNMINQIKLNQSDSNKRNKAVPIETHQGYSSSHQKQIKKNSNNFWPRIKTPALDNKDNITQILKKRFKKQNDLSLDICCFNYESLSLLNQTKTPTLYYQ